MVKILTNFTKNLNLFSLKDNFRTNCLKDQQFLQKNLEIVLFEAKWVEQQFRPQN